MTSTTAANGETSMKPELPHILARYFAAQNAHDIDGMVACFAPDAAVHDEGHDIIGTDAVRAWKQETSAKYRIAAEPLECTRRDGRTIVVVKVSGTFNGSPAKLTYRFGFSGEGLIDALEVR
jgi:SnoaL-like domain